MERRDNLEANKGSGLEAAGKSSKCRELICFKAYVFLIHREVPLCQLLGVLAEHDLWSGQVGPGRLVDPFTRFS